MLNAVRRFGSDERGAITVDYVVLAAALIGLGLSVVNAVRLGTFEARDDIVQMIEEAGSAGCSAGAGGASVGNCGN